MIKLSMLPIRLAALACAALLAFGGIVPAFEGPDPTKQRGVEVSAVKIEKGVLTATATNKGKQTYKSAHLRFDLLDAKGKKVGNAAFSRPKFKPGEVWQVRHELLAVSATQAKVHFSVAVR